MPTVFSNKAAEVIGTVESSLKWDSTNLGDPITIGIMQWYGTRAAGVLNKPALKARWGELAASLRASLETYAPGNGSYWPNRWLTTAESESLKPLLSSPDGKAAQLETWEADYIAMRDEFAQWGFSENEPKKLIMIMSAYHQTPARGRTIARNYTGAATLASIHAAILNEPVLGRYKTRYNTVYNMLNAWDGVSPPDGDWGTVVGPLPPPGDGDDNTNPDPGTTPPDNPLENVGLVRIMRHGDHLYGYTKDGRRIIFYRDVADQWRPRAGATAGGGVVPPDDTPTPDPPPDTGTPPEANPDGWVHPCPARTRMSSGSQWEPGGRSPHRGVDFAAPMYTPIYAVAAGVVIKAGPSSGFGNAIGIRHDDGVATGYGHMRLDSFKVKTGDRVTQGQHIAGVASEGQSSGPHLHFEVYSGGQWASGHIWPEKALRDRGVASM